ncbi:uncharacterized protein LOC143299761 isoform X7 [Babylonia areolata]|uniref:uncharacterized protein LOC143299761 isoform X7 n=1 Tax=Babylonia areolata TaxID=304850 RepID=UPI003FD53CAB
MDSDSSTKFIGSLTKFLQSLCNGYVEFQRGVELVGHIYLSIDTGEKVDYILHERVSKNDENSVTFVSNSFHALPHDKEKTPENKDNSSKFGAGSKSRRDSSDDDDIMIVDQSKRVPGSSNSGSIPVRGVKRGGSPSSSERHAQRMRGVGGPSSASNRGSSSFQQNNRQHSGASQSTSQQEGLNISDVKLEQISKDELMTLASQVGDGGSRPPHAASASHSHSPRSEGAMWIKQEAADDDDGGGNETGWSHGRDDSNSNSGSNLYPVMLHQNPAAYSGPAFPGFPGHGSGSQSATNPYADPLPGTSQDSSGLDPSDGRQLFPVEEGEAIYQWIRDDHALHSGHHTADDHVRLSGHHTPAEIPATQKKNRPYRKCRVCARKGIRHDTRWYCPVCPSRPPLCPSDCFTSYHSKLVFWT